MHDEPLYLRPDVQVEPLIDQWYAWSHMIPPATASRHLTHRYLRIMDSYLGNPQAHASAVSNPKMLGGPFVDHGGSRTEEIRALRDGIKTKRKPLVELSAALEQLDEMLQTAPNGKSLAPLYAQVPEPLRGYVELVYDLRHNASFRVIEPLLYQSDFYDTSGQSLMLSITSGDDRPFVLSTPRLESSGTVHLHWTFDDPRIDELFRLKTAPEPWRRIEERLRIPEAARDLFKSFLTPNAPAPYQPYTGSGVRWRYFGHACILVETCGVTLLFDPVLSYTYESEISRYTYADLPDRIDYVLITHNHQDHLLLETLLQIRHKVHEIIVPRSGSGTLPDPSLKLTLEHAGFSRVRELAELETLSFDGGSITGIPFLGEHSDLPVATKLAYVVRLGGERLMFAADSCNLEPRMYDHVHRAIGDVGTLFLGMECDGAPLSWIYGPLLLRPIERGMDQSRRLSGSDFTQADALVRRFGCRDVYVYAMGQEPWLNYVMSIKYTEASRPIIESNKLLAACHANGIVAERLFGEKEILIDRLAGNAPRTAGQAAQHAAAVS
jgi:L-ascorbate metabolism protein UlaG (beta-lactamase superfamily)